MNTDNVILLFQEVTSWAAVDGREFAGRRFKILAPEGSESALILPSSLAMQIVLAAAGREWAGCSTETLIILSLHLLPWEVDRFTLCLNSVSQFLYEHNKDRDKVIIVGIDANVTLRADVDGHVGPAVLAPLSSQSKYTAGHTAIQHFLCEHGLIASNTQEHIDQERLWTCGRNRN